MAGEDAPDHYISDDDAGLNDLAGLQLQDRSGAFIDHDGEREGVERQSQVSYHMMDGDADGGSASCEGSHITSDPEGCIAGDDEQTARANEDVGDIDGW